MIELNKDQWNVAVIVSRWDTVLVVWWSMWCSWIFCRLESSSSKATLREKRREEEWTLFEEDFPKEEAVMKRENHCLPAFQKELPGSSLLWWPKRTDSSIICPLSSRMWWKQPPVLKIPILSLWAQLRLQVLIIAPTVMEVAISGGMTFQLSHTDLRRRQRELVSRVARVHLVIPIAVVMMKWQQEISVLMNPCIPLRLNQDLHMILTRRIRQKQTL